MRLRTRGRDVITGLRTGPRDRGGPVTHALTRVWHERRRAPHPVDSPMPRFNYGGQALIEGVMMRGRDAIAVALRHPDGRIV